MMKAFKLLFLLVFALPIIEGCSPFASTRLTETDTAPARLHSAEVTQIDTVFTVIGYTKSYPPKPVKRIEGFTYQIEFSLVGQNGIDTLRESFRLRLQPGDGREIILGFNEDGRAIAITTPHFFSGAFEITEKSPVTVCLGFAGPDGKYLFTESSPLCLKISL